MARRVGAVAAITLIAHIHVVPLTAYALPFALTGLPLRDACWHYPAFVLSCGAIVLASPYLKAAGNARQREPLLRSSPKRTGSSAWQAGSALVAALLRLRGTRAAILALALAAPAMGCLAVARAAALAVAHARVTSVAGAINGASMGAKQGTSTARGPVALWDLAEVRAAAAWLCGAAVHYAYVAGTYRGSPEISGSRDTCGSSPRWPRVAAFMAELSVETADYFQGRIVATVPLVRQPADRPQAEDQGPYVFGFHPHGVLPLTTLWLRLNPQWQAVAPDFALLTASVVHYIPVMRDLLQWLGSREVSRASIAGALGAGRSVMLVPGGQAEMLESRSGARRLRLVTRHRGAIRVAIEHGAALVPVLSFGETELMDNVHLPCVQRWFVRRFGLPPFHMPYGVLGLPVPRPHPVTVCLGAPIRPPRLQPGQEPTAEMVDALHHEYYGALAALFHKFRAEAGFAELELELLG